MKKYIGYARISSDKQLREDNTLDLQAAQIRERAAKDGLELLGIYEDVASAARDGDLMNRPDLDAALSHAKREGAILIVTDISRLFRNVDQAKAALATCDVEVFSIADNRILPRKTLLQQVRRAQTFAENVQDATRRAKVNTGQSPALSPSSTKISKSVISRKNRAAIIAEQIAEVLKEHPDHLRLTHKELAAILNARGIYSGHGKTWTPGSVRRQREAAIDVLRERAEIERIEMTVSAGSAADDTASAEAAKKARDAADLEEMKKNPMFGMF